MQTSVSLGAYGRTGIKDLTEYVPSTTAMTAMSLHSMSDGRVILGPGVSGPQVVEGRHGASYKAPLSRLRETVEI